ncbi:MAG: copper chaperone PCu(A)C [Rhodocyclaceae bacterium]|nr:copper chaperone PCu(A)C [Rhodocyclaceae bacterium]MDZ4213570.1 copper chaperone PCu(A)C [Rhodocyclaceae bacterium]
MNKHFALTLLLATSFATPVFAAGAADQISVFDPYVRMAPPGAKTTGAFMVIKNAGDKDTQLVSANAQAANVTELHNHINDNGVMRMRQVKEIAVPAKGEAVLKPGGYHVMLIDMKAPLKEGDHVVIKLGFGDGSSKEVHASVTKSNIGMSAPMDHSNMKH